MFGKLLLAFTIIPMLELWLLISVGSHIGALTTIAIVILTGAAGAWLARMQGLKTLARVQQNLNQGIMPADELLDGVIILFAGAVLLTPGFLTDITGLLLLFPPTREPAKAWLKKKAKQWSAKGVVTIDQTNNFM